MCASPNCMTGTTKPYTHHCTFGPKVQMALHSFHFRQFKFYSFSKVFLTLVNLTAFN